MEVVAYVFRRRGDANDDDNEQEDKDIKRVGRRKLLLLADGRVCVARCVAADDKSDIALLRLDDAYGPPMMANGSYVKKSLPCASLATQNAIPGSD
eukprot:4600917-Ditylum_brightwellii.AAC.1